MSASPRPSLNELMARLAEGDRAAFAPVFETLWSPIRQMCAAMLKNDADAEDAAQETLQKVLNRASDYDRTRPALPWAMAIAAWECRTILRRRSRRKEVEVEDLELPSEHPAVGLEKRNLIAAALKSLEDLSAMDREVLVATYSEQAGAGTDTTVRKRRERALTRLRNAFRRVYGLD